MSDADVKAYEGKFTDLDGMDGRRHFMEIGQDEGRWNHAAKNLTETMAQRYLDMHWDL